MPELCAELKKYMKSDNVSIAELLQEPGEKSETGTITEVDVKTIVDGVTAGIANSGKGILGYYRRNSLTFVPPEPKTHGSQYSSELYHRLYTVMLQLPMYKSDQIRQKIWALIEIEKESKDKDLKAVSDKIETKICQWESISKKESISIIEYINENIAAKN